MRIMGSAVTRFIDEIPTYEIRDGIVHVTVGDFELCCASMRTFRLATEAATRCLAEHDAKSAEIRRLKFGTGA